MRHPEAFFWMIFFNYLSDSAIRRENRVSQGKSLCVPCVPIKKVQIMSKRQMTPAALGKAAEVLGLRINNHSLLDIRDKLRPIVRARAENTKDPPDYEKMSAFVESKYGFKVTAELLIRLLA